MSLTCPTRNPLLVEEMHFFHIYFSLLFLLFLLSFYIFFLRILYHFVVGGLQSKRPTQFQFWFWSREKIIFRLFCGREATLSLRLQSFLDHRRCGREGEVFTLSQNLTTRWSKYDQDIKDFSRKKRRRFGPFLDHCCSHTKT